MIQLLWYHNLQEEDSRFTLIVVHNEFNEGKLTTMLWAVQHEWHSGAQFTFNCFHHWSTLVIIEGGEVTLCTSKKESHKETHL